MRYILTYVTALAFSLDFCGTAHALSVFLHVLPFIVIVNDLNLLSIKKG